MRFYRSSSDPSIRGVVDAFGVVAVAQSTLERHGGRVLKPSEVVAVPGTTVRPTVYRWAFLLVPDDILQDRAHLRGHGEELDEVYGGDHHRECGAVHRLNDALVTAGMELEPPPPLDGDDALGPYLPYLRRLPRAARLRVRRGGPPAVVDAWVALQTLRTAADADDSGVLPGIVDRIAMDHLLVGSAVTGGIVAAGPPTEGSPETGDGAPSAVIRPEYGRLPVDVLMSMPPRRSLAELGGQRRAVVAVLDTGVDTNRYLGVTDGPPSDWGTEPFVTVDPVIQEQVRQSTQRDHDNGVPTEVIPDFRERPVSGGLLLDDLNSHIGHGTFIAGVVRQVSPDVELRAIRIMLGDGIAPENALVTALELLNARLDRAADAAAAHQPVDPDDIVDVVSLSLGCFLETEQDAQIVAPLLAAVRGLAARGVIVVAAAGNFSTTRPFFPAFLAAGCLGLIALVLVSRINVGEGVGS